MSEHTARRGALAGFAAGATWIALGAESALRGGSMHYRDLLWMVPWILTMTTFGYLHALQRHRAGRLERWSFRVVIASMALTLAGTTAVLLDIDALKMLGFPLGALLWLLATVPFGIATALAGVVPRYVGVALVLLEPGALLAGLLLSPILAVYDRGNYWSGVEKGLVIFLLAGSLWRLARPRAAARPEIYKAAH
jgi:hypothetical protein